MLMGSKQIKNQTGNEKLIMSNLKESTLLSSQAFKGKLLDVRLDEVLLPNNTKSTREWIKHPGGVCTIPLFPNNEIGLINQYRYPVRRVLIELPAGKIDKNEEPEQTALRELEEEIGYKAKKLTFLTEMYPAVGFASERMIYFIAESLVKTQTCLDNDEFIDFFTVKISTALEMVWSGKIKDGKTIIGLLWLSRYLEA